MISRARFNISLVTGRRSALLGILGLFALVAAACSVQETNTYPIESFTEMHYSQASRAQEPPRLQPPAESVAYETAGGPDASLSVPEFQKRAYDPAVAGQLYSVNCAVCHGVNGGGDGTAAPHLTSNVSYWATTTGSTYAAPPNLVAIRGDRTPEVWFTIVNNGINVMPKFGKLLSEEEIWDIVTYLFDEQTGLGTAQ